MAQATFSIRMDENLKKQFDALCSDFGMNATTAFNIFAKAVVRERKIPFEISSPSDTTLEDAKAAFWEMRRIAAENGLQDMTLDDINAEIAAVDGAIRIRFTNEAMMFEGGKTVLKPEFETVLSEFFGRLIKVVGSKEFCDDILEIRIEGHTMKVQKENDNEQD